MKTFREDFMVFLLKRRREREFKKNFMSEQQIRNRAYGCPIVTFNRRG